MKDNSKDRVKNRGERADYEMEKFTFRLPIQILRSHFVIRATQYYYKNIINSLTLHCGAP